MVFAGGVAGLADRHIQRCEYSVTWVMNADPPMAVCTIEHLSILPSQIS